MSFRGGEFSTGTTGNFQPELTRLLRDEGSLPMSARPMRLEGASLFLRFLQKGWVRSSPSAAPTRRFACGFLGLPFS